MSDMCEESYNQFQDQVECARYRAERDALAQAVQTVCERMEAHFLGVEGMGESPVASWARDLRAALGSLHCFQNSRLADTGEKVDRDALLALANEMEQETGSVCGVCMGKSARRIREALGVER